MCKGDYKEKCPAPPFAYNEGQNNYVDDRFKLRLIFNGHILHPILSFVCFSNSTAREDVDEL